MAGNRKRQKRRNETVEGFRTARGVDPRENSVLVDYVDWDEIEPDDNEDEDDDE